MSNLSHLLHGRDHPRYLRLSDLAPHFKSSPSLFYGTVRPTRLTTELLRIYEALSPPATTTGTATAAARAQQAVLAMDSLGWSPEFLSRLSFGIALPLKEAVRICQLDAPEGWPARAYHLIRRPDLAQQISGQRHKPRVAVRVCSYLPTCGVRSQLTMRMAGERTSAHDRGDL